MEIEIEDNSLELCNTIQKNLIELKNIHLYMEKSLKTSEIEIDRIINTLKNLSYNDINNNYDIYNLDDIYNTTINEINEINEINKLNGTNYII